MKRTYRERWIATQPPAAEPQEKRPEVPRDREEPRERAAERTLCEGEILQRYEA